MRYEEIRRVVTKHFAALLASKKANIRDVGRLSEAEIASYERNAANAEEATNTGLPLKPHLDDAKIMNAFIERYGLPVKPGSDTYATLRTESRSPIYSSSPTGCP
jgi:hypothetical protein